MSFTQDEFADLVHDALKHLYDSPYLQRHPLTRLLSESAAVATKSQELRRLLLDAIGSLRPKPGVPSDAMDWRGYRILELRFIEGLEPRDVMEQVALGRSHFFREQDRVLNTVAAILWDRWQQNSAEKEASTGYQTLDLEKASRQSLARSEAEHLSTQMEWESVNLSELLVELCTFVEQLAQAKKVAIRLEIGDKAWVRDADRVLVRQAILNALTYGLGVAYGGELSVQVHLGSVSEVRESAGDESERGVSEEGIFIHAHTAPGQQEATPDKEQAGRAGVGLEICRQLLKAMGGRLEIAGTAGGEWQAHLLWPTSRQDILLVVDNNASFIDLFRRYLARYTWNVIGATSSADARHILTELQPAAIVLDVMMPKEDGWELLHSIRANRTTQKIPVIICSVLNEPELAQTLGATAYLPKPVSQQDLLRALARLFPNASIPVPAH